MHLIERTLRSNKGVEKAVVALATSRGHVEFDPTVLGPRDVIKMIEVEKLQRKRERERGGGGEGEKERREGERERERDSESIFSIIFPLGCWFQGSSYLS